MVGAGIEAAIDQNWSLRLEGLVFIADQTLIPTTIDADPGDFVTIENPFVLRFGLSRAI